jgi:hypothetical protein
MSRVSTAIYGRFHRALLAAARRAPISSKVFGPPKGFIGDVRQWVESYRREHPSLSGECWYRSFSPRSLRGDSPLHRLPRSLPSMPTPFLGHEQVELMETFCASIPGARLITRTGIIVSPDDRFFQQSCVLFDPIFFSDIEYNSLRPLLKPIKLSGPYATIISRYHTNYFHWLTECLSKPCILDALPEVPLLLPPLNSWQRDSLRSMGVRDDRLVEVDASACYETDQLYFPFVGTTGNIATSPLRALRHKLCGERQVKPGKRLYVGRTDAGYRRVTNEDEVIRALTSEGFTVVEGSRLSFAQQVDLYADAEVIIGVHGAGMGNLTFAPAGALVIETLDPEHMNPCFYLLCTSLGQTYWCLSAGNESVRRGLPVKKGYDDINIPVETLMQTLQAALAGSRC